MRSRYAAHVLVRIDYLLDTQHPDTRAGVERSAVERWARESTWLGLRIVETQGGGEGDDDGIVEFEASYRARGVTAVHRERSHFRRHEGRWLYVDGSTPPLRRASTAGRNDPCPCGSGKKYKRCCGR
jgi:SEC-C motif-containing protein